MTDRQTPDPRTPDRTPDPRTTEPDQTGPARWPLFIALAFIAGVWLAGCVWSFEEQTALAASKLFHVPELLPLVIDGMAVAMAAVAFAANLDGRPALFARIGTGLSVASSAASNATWAWERSAGDLTTVALAAAVPVVANLAFEVLLSEVRKQVQRRRGVPAPVPIPKPRPIRLVLAPFATVALWRRLVLEATDPRLAFESVRSGGQPRRRRVQTPDPAPDPSVQADPTPDRAPDRTADAGSDRTLDRRAKKQTGPPDRVVRTLRSTDDEADLAKLRAWRAEYGRTPSLDQTQEIVGCGRSKAVRLRGLLAADQTDDDKERVRVDAELIGASA